MASILQLVLNSLGHIIRVNWVKVHIILQESSWNTSSSGALGHVVKHVGWTIAVDQVSVEDGHGLVVLQSTLLSILTHLHP